MAVINQLNFMGLTLLNEEEIILKCTKNNSTMQAYKSQIRPKCMQTMQEVGSWKETRKHWRADAAVYS